MTLVLPILNFVSTILQQKLYFVNYNGQFSSIFGLLQTLCCLYSAWYRHIREMRHEPSCEETNGCKKTSAVLVEQHLSII